MVAMINKTFGNTMFVSEDRVEEYLAAGHVLAADSAKTEKPKQKRSSETKRQKK